MINAELYDIYPAIFQGITINNIQQVDPSPGVKQLIHTAGGAVDPSVIAMAFAEPSVAIKSCDIKNILTNVGLLTGLEISSSATMQYQRRGGTSDLFSGAGANVTLTSVLGRLILEEFGADQDSDMGIDAMLKYYPLSSDGLTAPLIFNSGASLSGSASVAEVYTLGPAVIEGSEFAGLQKCRIKTGIEYQVKRSGGSVFAQDGTIRKRNPVIEIEAFNASFLGYTGMYSKKLTSGVTCYFQKVDPGAGPVAHGSAVHLSVSASTGTYVVEGLSVQKEGDANLRITIHPTGTLSKSVATSIPV